jgi:hypothetical protein
MGGRNSLNMSNLQQFPDCKGKVKTFEYFPYQGECSKTTNTPLIFLRFGVLFFIAVKFLLIFGTSQKEQWFSW